MPRTDHFGTGAVVVAALDADTLVPILLAKPANARFTPFFSVHSAGDEPNANPWDDVCATSSGAGTLRPQRRFTSMAPRFGARQFTIPAAQGEGGERNEP